MSTIVAVIDEGEGVLTVSGWQPFPPGEIASVRVAANGAEIGIGPFGLPSPDAPPSNPCCGFAVKADVDPGTLPFHITVSFLTGAQTVVREEKVEVNGRLLPLPRVDQILAEDVPPTPHLLMKALTGSDVLWQSFWTGHDPRREPWLGRLVYLRETLRQFRDLTPEVHRAIRAALARRHGGPLEFKDEVQIVGMLCQGGIAALRIGDIEHPSVESLLITMQEILIEKEYFLNLDTSSPRFVDCGSSFGLSLAYLKQLYPQARCIGFEPVPHIAAMCRRNIERLGLEGVELIECALGARDGTAAMRFDPAHALAGRVVAPQDDEQTTRVSVRRLSPYLDEPTHFLKLDIEGGEREVLPEIAPKLPNVQHLFCEYHQAGPHPMSGLAAILGVLEDAGFVATVAKSLSTHRRSHVRPFTHTLAPYSATIFATNPNFGTGG